MTKQCAVVAVVAISLITITVDSRGGRKTEYTNKLTTLFEAKISMAMLSLSNVSAVTMPLPIRLVLCKLKQFSRGEARDEINKAFHFLKDYKTCHEEVPVMTNLLSQFTIIFLNKIYVNDTKDLNDHFFDKASTHTFGVHAEKRAFIRPTSSRTYINRWFELASLKRLTDILDYDDVDYDTSIIAVSAAHIKSTWEKPFNPLKTKTAKFRTKDDKKVNVQMMTIRDNYLYCHDPELHIQMVSIPFTSRGMSMTFLLPDAPGSFGRVATKIHRDPAVLQRARNSMRSKMLSISLPRFRIKSTHIWDGAIKLLGINQIFNSTYSGIDGLLKSNIEVQNMFISLVKQKVVLEVDEMGAFRNGIPQDKPDSLDKMFPLMKARKLAADFEANHPFLFSIDMEVNKGGDKSMFLVGTYYGPDS